MSDHATPVPRRVFTKPPPIDLGAIQSSSSLTPTRLQLWSALRVAPEAETPGVAPTPRNDGALSPGSGLSPVTGGFDQASGWGGLPSHILELIFASLRDAQGRWPSRKVLFSVCGVCKLWRRVGHTLFFSNVWQNHSDVVVHPCQLFQLSPQPLRLHTSEHLLRCFVQRTPCSSGGLSPRFGRLWRFTMYLGSDHRGGGRMTSGASAGGQPARPQLLMWARQTSRRSYQLLLSPSGPGPGPGGGGVGLAGGSASGWGSPPPGARGRGRGSRESGVVAVLRSNMRCSHYELLPEASCPWARRLIAVAGYMPPLGGPPTPLVSLEYRLRVRGIMLPRRMKVQVPVPHSLQRVVSNPLYDMHEPLSELPSPVAPAEAWLPALAGRAGGGGGPAVMAPPVAGGGPAAVAAAGAGAGAVGAGWLGDGGEGLMDNLEDILEAAMRTEPLLFANMVDAAAAVRPAEDDDGAVAAAAGAAAAAAGGGDAAAGGGGGGLRHQRRSGGLGGLLLRGFLQSRRQHGLRGGQRRQQDPNQNPQPAQPAGAAAGAGAAGDGGGGQVHLGGPGSPRERARSADGTGAVTFAKASGLLAGSGAGWASASSAAHAASSVAAAPTPQVRLQNKAPHWNDALMCWCLNFRGRVKMASVKNFQLMCSADAAGRCVMQFGKVEEGTYILDFNPCVLTAAQAFAAALSTFETKYLL